MTLPVDGHVHSEWSWDTRRGDLEATCARAVELGLPGVVFTEHLDFSRWHVEDGDLDGLEHLREHLDAEGRLAPPPLDVTGYLASVRRCRALFPDLRIVSGAEFGDPHRNAGAAAALLEAGAFERVLGSLHTVPVGDRFYEPPGLFRQAPAERVMRNYLAEAARLITESAAFHVFAHIDYAVRYWPANAPPFRAQDFEAEFRHALRLLAGSGRALEVNTRVPLAPTILDWWRQAGGRSIAFGSDAHDPGVLGRGLAAAAAMAREHGFEPGDRSEDLWRRTA